MSTSPQMRCEQFLERYSDYRDKLIDAELRRTMIRHLAACARCRRYDARVARGVLVLRSAHELEPSRRVLSRVVHGLASEADPGELEPLAPRTSRYVAGLAVAVTVVLLVSQSGALRDPAPAVGATPIATATLAAPESMPSPPPPTRPRPEAAVADDPDLTVPAFGRPWRTPSASEEPFITTISAARQ